MKLYHFEWDPNKAKDNVRKHKISFEGASTIFHDPRAVSIFDKEHSESEERWITMGIDINGNLLVVIHTFKQADESNYRIRIISAREATKKETKQYKEENT
jgi:uncharacterized DUF497 family protein